MSYVDTRGNWSQAMQRRGQRFTDQHGRKYFAPIEIKTGEPCGLIGAEYTAPLTVPLNYLKRSKDANRPYDLVIDYPKWQADIRAELKEWETAWRKAAVRRYGDEFDPKKGMPADIAELFPRPPIHEEPVIAAKQGNKWVLGLSSKVDPRLAKFFAPEVTDPDYREKQEPDFRDMPDELDSDVRAIVADTNAAADDEGQTVAGEAAFDLEDEIDADAVGGKRVPVGAGAGKRSLGAERKALYRANKKKAAAGAKPSDDEE